VRSIAPLQEDSEQESRRVCDRPLSVTARAIQFFGAANSSDWPVLQAAPRA
jgi:hypothetical protein